MPKPVIKISGMLLEADVVQPSGRVYPKEVLKEAIEKVQEQVENRGMLGTLDFQDFPVVMEPQHDGLVPEDDWEDTFGDSFASHFVTKLEMDDKGRVFVECQVLDTGDGERLKKVLGQCVLRARGFGEVEKKHGRTFVKNYTLKTVDFLPDPEDADEKIRGKG